jgi:type IV pilus assembly protein PilM
MGLKLLNRQKIELAGLDIGNATVKLVRLKRTPDGYTLISAAAEPIEPSDNDDNVHRQNVLNAVRNCLQKSNWKSKSVVCGISGPDVVVRGFTFPPLPDAAIEQAVRMEAQQVCPLDMSKSTLDFQLIEKSAADGPKTASKARPRCGVMAVGTQRAIEERTALLAEAGTKAMMVDVDCLAMLNCLNELKLLKATETIAIIDIGSALTNVVIYGCDGLPFVRNINKAGGTIIQQISRDLKMPEKDIWQTFTLESPTNQLDDRLLLSLNNAIVPLVNAINETLRFYSFQEKKSNVDRIFLCGGFALIAPFVEFLGDALSVPVESLNPFTKIHCDENDKQQQALQKNGPVYAIATGLAMRTVS